MTTVMKYKEATQSNIDITLHAIERYRKRVDRQGGSNIDINRKMLADIRKAMQLNRFSLKVGTTKETTAIRISCVGYIAVAINGSIVTVYENKLVRTKKTKGRRR